MKSYCVVIDRPMTVRQLADILQISKPTAYRLVRFGIIDSVRVGNRYRITIEALNRFLNTQG